MEENNDERESIFEKKEKKPSFSQVKMKKGIVVSINKVKGKITIDVSGNGEMCDYIEERHSKLSVGDPIEF